MQLSAVFLLALLAAPAFANPVDAETPDQLKAKTFTSLYQEFCFRHVADSDGLLRALHQAQATPRPSELSSGVLQGAKGQAWLLRNPSGVFFVALLADGTCRTIAEIADPGETEFLFRSFVEKAPPPLRAQRDHYEIRKNPTGQRVRSIGVDWRGDNLASHIRFQLQVAREPTGVQAVIDIQQKRGP